MAVPGTVPQDFDVETALAATDRLPYTKDIGGGNFAPRRISPADFLSTAGTLDASEINNDSGVIGATADVALDNASVGGLGAIEGYVVSFSSTTAVAISLGDIEANGAYYTLAADTTFTLAGLVNGFDIQYIYIDDSASTAPTAVFINSLTEPAFDAAKRGWYNGDDRMIGYVNIGTGIATIVPFETVAVGNKLVRVSWGQEGDPQFNIATAQNPDGAFQTPNVRETSTNTCVNAIEVRLKMFNTDTGSSGALAASGAEYAVLQPAIFDGLVQTEWDGRGDVVEWIPLGASRNVRIGAPTNDDNNFRSYNMGVSYQR